MAIDPTCKTLLNSESAKFVHTDDISKNTFYFCSDLCLQEFKGVRKE
ncbi:hypothetical protein HY989_05105 [Candidatus Micrarchaeota archaeon]|nr:hypothetical protein [Candidatus Micrarchaeota archaeon]